MNFHSNYKRTECGPSQFGCSNMAQCSDCAICRSTESVERAPGSQQEPTFDGVQSDFLKTIFLIFSKLLTFFKLLWFFKDIFETFLKLFETFWTLFSTWKFLKKLFPNFLNTLLKLVWNFLKTSLKLCWKFFETFLTLFKPFLNLKSFKFV